MQRRSRISIGKKAGGINRVNNEGDSLGGFHLRIAAFDAGCANATAGQAINREKGWVINRVNNEGDSLGGFHLRIAAFDSGWANAAAEQDGLSIINKEKGWCALRTLHIAHPT